VNVKPYPDREQGRFIGVTDLRGPGWLTEIMEGRERVLSELLDKDATAWVAIQPARAPLGANRPKKEE